MFIDDYGNEFETEKDIEDFAKKEFDNLNADDLADIMEDYFTVRQLLKWIFKNDRDENFIKDNVFSFKLAKHGFVKDYFLIHDIEEV